MLDFLDYFLDGIFQKNMSPIAASIMNPIGFGRIDTLI
jgi:hypothetical protein